eukprot:tig00020563_g11389.t1
MGVVQSIVASIKTLQFGGESADSVDAALQLLDYAKDDDVRHLIIEQGGLPVIVNKLGSSSPELQSLAASIILNLAIDPHLRDIVGEEAGCIPRLSELLDTRYSQLHSELDLPPILEASTGAIQNLAATDPTQKNVRKDRRLAIADAGAVPKLAAVLSSPAVTADVKKSALWGLCNLATNERIARTIEDRYLDPIMKILGGDVGSSEGAMLDRREVQNIQSVALFAVNNALSGGSRGGRLRQNARAYAAVQELSQSPLENVRKVAFDVIRKSG